MRALLSSALLLTCCLVPGGQASGAGGGVTPPSDTAFTTRVMSSRAAAITALNRHQPDEALLTKRCGLWNPETKTSRLAFPTGRADLLLLETAGRGFAYRTQGNGTVQLLWCGTAFPPTTTHSVLPGTAAGALAFPYRTAWGRFPREMTTFDTYTGFTQRLTVSAGQPQQGQRCSHTYNLTGYGLSFPSVDLLRFSCDGHTVIGSPQ